MAIESAGVVLASSVLALFLGETVDAFVVLAVVVLNTIIGFVTDSGLLLEAGGSH